MKCQSVFYNKVILLSFIPLGLYICYVILNHNYVSSIIYSKPIQFSDPFTELYFLNPQHTLVPSQSNPLSFVIHNAEQKDMQYTYEVGLGKNQLNDVFTKSTILVKKNETKIIQIPLIFSNDSSKNTLFIKLLNKNQSIHMSLNNQV